MPKPGFYNFGGLGCARLPSPILFAPDLLKPKAEELTDNLSCGEIAWLNVQSESGLYQATVRICDSGIVSLGSIIFHCLLFFGSPTYKLS
jgi:hypothetical protein